MEYVCRYGLNENFVRCLFNKIKVMFLGGVDWLGFKSDWLLIESDWL